MKNHLVRSLLVLGLLGSLVAIGATPAGTQRSPGSYAEPGYGFTLAPPPFAEVNQDRAVVAIFQAPPQDGFASNVTVMVDPVKTTRKEYMQASMAAMESTNPRATIRSLKELQVSGLDAELLDYDANMAGRRLRFLQLLVVAADRVYVVTCTAPVETFAKFEGQFRQCIDSFKVDKR